MPGIRRFIHPEVKQLVLHMEGKPGMSRSQIRRLTGVAESTQRRVRALHTRTGLVTSPPLRCGRVRMLDAADISFLEGSIERTPDLTLKELQAALEEVRGVVVSVSTISRSLQRRELSRVRLSRPALERDEEARIRYRMRMSVQYNAEQLVFVDESHVNRLTTRRGYGWARRGQRATRRDFFIRGKRYSMVPALSLDGILALDVFAESFTAEKFHNFVDMVLDAMNPFPQRNSVLVMDNASIHHSEGLREMVEARGMRLEYLPTYSPDLNPIEEAFSSIKAWIRSNRDYALCEILGDEGANPYAMICNAVYSVTPEKARGWFKHSGYL